MLFPFFIYICTMIINDIIQNELLPIFNTPKLNSNDISEILKIRDKVGLTTYIDISPQERSNILTKCTEYFIKIHCVINNIIPYKVRTENYYYYIFAELNKGKKGTEKRYLAYYPNVKYLQFKTPTDTACLLDTANKYFEPKIIVGIIGYADNRDGSGMTKMYRAIEEFTEYGNYSYLDWEFFNIFDLKINTMFHGENRTYRYYVSNLNPTSCAPSNPYPIGLKYTNTNDDVLYGDIVKVKFKGSREAIRQVQAWSDNKPNNAITHSLMHDPNGGYSHYDILQKIPEKIELFAFFNTPVTLSLAKSRT